MPFAGTSLTRRVGVLAAASLLAASAVVPLATSATAAPSMTKIVLTQSEPTIVHEEGQSATSATGDVTFFESNLTRAGKSFGTLSGIISTHDVVVQGAARETRLRTLVFELPKGQIVAMGSSTYPTGADFVPLQVDKTVVIPIAGGSGLYIGARGELRTTRNADGTYRQVILLVRS